MLAGYGHLLRAADRLQWDERALELSADAGRFRELPAAQARAIRRMVAGFCVAETAVADHLKPFEEAARSDELQACFAAQAMDEARHARFFARVAREVCALDPDHEAREVAGAVLVELFERTLPERAAALADGRCGLDEAVGLYHLLIEGIVFAVGQETLAELVEAELPTVTHGLRRVQGDERWHIGLGVTLLAEARLGEELAEALLGDAKSVARAWGTDLVDEERVTRILELHRRRLRMGGLITDTASAS